jgi:SAM-dependent methyltransferase
MNSARTRLDLQSIFRLTELADYVIPFALRVVCDLGVADHLRDGPRPCDELAAATGAHAPSLYRVMRALACKNIFTEVESGKFALTPMAELLLSDHPLSLRGAYPLMAGDVKAWAHFDHSVRTGEAAFERAHGQGYWQYMAEHRDESAKLDGAQRAQTRLELKVVLRAYDWSPLRHVVDVGGGNGAFLTGLLARYPSLRGTLCDLGHVVEAAAHIAAKAGVSDRLEVAAGSFFETLPAGADAYVLKRILYGWDDAHAARLLANIRRAMPPDGRLLILEPVMDAGHDTEMSCRYDLLMLAMSGTRARSREELEALLREAGFTLSALVPTLMFPIVDARPA